jgi:hypothetical protein
MDDGKQGRRLREGGPPPPLPGFGDGVELEVEARESYTPPEESYRMAKRAGMDFVTLTDHETIEGAVTLEEHPDFFVGEEVSARFPE